MIRRGFTLIEVLVSIAIIALLTTLLVPTIDRSLSRNNLANDVSLLRSKLEETRLMAGSTQQIEGQTTGYYAVMFLSGSRDYFSILRVDDTVRDPSPVCPIGTAVGDGTDPNGGLCEVERVKLSKNVSLTNGQGNSVKLVLFRSPTQQVSEAHHIGRCGQNGCYSSPDGLPIFSSWGSDVKLQFQAKTATVTLDDYTAKLSVEYRDN